MGARSEFSDFELQSLQNMEREGVRESQFKSDDDAGEFSYLFPSLIASCAVPNS